MHDYPANKPESQLYSTQCLKPSPAEALHQSACSEAAQYLPHILGTDLVFPCSKPLVHRQSKAYSLVTGYEYDTKLDNSNPT